MCSFAYHEEFPKRRNKFSQLLDSVGVTLGLQKKTHSPNPFIHFK